MVPRKISASPTTGRSSALGASLTEVAGPEKEIAAEIGKLFIQRRDVRAEQSRFNGKWARQNQPFKMADVIAHVRGEKSYGHYLLDQESRCRVFALDIDLVDTKMSTLKHGTPEQQAKYVPCFYPGPNGLVEYNPREAWTDRAHPYRAQTKKALKFVAEEIASVIVGEMELPCLVSYSGSKGMHVYAILHESVGGPGPLAAEDAREGAILVLERTGRFVPSHGKNFYRAIDQNPINGFPQVEVEIFPKQARVGEGGFGNLMRLPLGRNFKSKKDRSFFVDLGGNLDEMVPADPLTALKHCNPFRELKGTKLGGATQ